MEKNRTLNTTCEWEEIVNQKAAHRAYERMVSEKIERERRQRKLWLTACGIATLGLTFMILGATGAVANWLATAIAVGSVACGSFVFGRYVEAKKG